MYKLCGYHNGNDLVLIQIILANVIPTLVGIAHICLFYGQDNSITGTSCRYATLSTSKPSASYQSQVEEGRSLTISEDIVKKKLNHTIGCLAIIPNAGCAGKLLIM